VAAAAQCGGRANNGSAASCLEGTHSGSALPNTRGPERQPQDGDVDMAGGPNEAGLMQPCTGRARSVPRRSERRPREAHLHEAAGPLAATHSRTLQSGGCNGSTLVRLSVCVTSCAQQCADASSRGRGRTRPRFMDDEVCDGRLRQARACSQGLPSMRCLSFRCDSAACSDRSGTASACGQRTARVAARLTAPGT
jgi:hypothetical protein